MQHFIQKLDGHDISRYIKYGSNWKNIKLIEIVGKYLFEKILYCGVFKRNATILWRFTVTYPKSNFTFSDSRISSPRRCNSQVSLAVLSIAVALPQRPPLPRRPSLSLDLWLSLHSSRRRPTTSVNLHRFFAVPPSPSLSIAPFVTVPCLPCFSAHSHRLSLTSLSPVVSLASQPSPSPMCYLNLNLLFKFITYFVVIYLFFWLLCWNLIGFCCGI